MNNNRIVDKRFIYIIVGVLFATALVFTSLFLYRRNTLSVAFYNIPESTLTELKKQIKDASPKHTTFKVLNSSRPLEKSAGRKYHMLFAWQGAQTEQFADKAVSPAENLYNLMPASIRNAGAYNGKNYSLPLLLDNVETSYYRTYRTKQKLEVPEIYEQFEPYLTLIKTDAQFPLFCAGKNNDILLDLVSALTESTTGTSGYTALVNQIKKNGTFTGSADFEIARTVKGTPITLRSVLDIIKQWQKNGLIHPSWYDASEQDVRDFMRDHTLGTVCMPLSEHRKGDLHLLRYYDTNRFPPSIFISRHSLIAPCICVVTFRTTAGETVVQNRLLSAEIQEQLSNASMLAPVTSRCPAYDRQADDVRYWAASCSGGPAAPIGLACFTDTVKEASFAEDIRSYIKQ